VLATSPAEYGDFQLFLANAASMPLLNSDSRKRALISPSAIVYQWRMKEAAGDESAATAALYVLLFDRTLGSGAVSGSVVWGKRKGRKPAAREIGTAAAIAQLIKLWRS